MLLGLPLTSALEFENNVDFSFPLIDKKLAVLVQATSLSKPNKIFNFNFWFIFPFNGIIWALIGGTTVAVAVVVFFFDHVIPAKQTKSSATASFTFVKSVWFACSSLICIGHNSQLWPKTISARFLAFGWRLCAAIIVYSYVAKLTANIIDSTALLPQKSAFSDNHLAELQSLALDFGTVKKSQLADYISDSNDPILSTMLMKMRDASRNKMVDSVSEGVRKVTTSSNYAFLWDNAALLQHHLLEMPMYECGAFTIFTELNVITNSLTIGLPRNSPHREKLSSVLMKMKQDGTLRRLENKLAFLKSLAMAKANWKFGPKPCVVHLISDLTSCKSNLNSITL